MSVPPPTNKGRLVGLCAPLLAACTALLPTAENITQGGWASFKEARDAIERIVPYTTGKADLLALGIDPYTNPAIAKTIPPPDRPHRHCRSVMPQSLPNLLQSV